MDEVTISPEALKHSEFLRDMSEQLLTRPITLEERRRLVDIAAGLRHRPELDVENTFRFKVGSTYPTREGNLVTIVKADETSECVQGDDSDSDRGFRYCRRSGTYDHGRCTATPDDAGRNLIPVEIVDPRIVGARVPLFASSRAKAAP